MSSLAGMALRSASEAVVHRLVLWLAAILATLARAGQARPLRGLAALAGLVVCLTGTSDPLRVLGAGAAGILVLTLALQRDAPGRLVFGGAALVLLLAYGWAGGVVGPGAPSPATDSGASESRQSTG